MAKEKTDSKGRNRYHHGNLRNELILETERMLDANELDKITLNELGKRLGVARSAPYRHFSNKNDLLCAVATRAFARLLATDRAIRLEKNLNPIERLRKIVHNYFYLAVNRRDYYRLMYRENLVGENESAELRSIRDENFMELISLLEECQQVGMIHQDDLEAQALFCWAPFHGMCSFIIDQHFPVEFFEAQMDWHVDSVLRGMGYRPD